MPLARMGFYDVNSTYYGVPSNSTCASAWTNGSFTCDFVMVDGYIITSPALIPTCFIAAAIGYYGYTTISKLSEAKGKFIYSLVFAMFGCMMTDAGWIDSLFGANGDPTDNWHLLFGVIDVGLTSSIGLTFGFIGAVDIGWVSDQSKVFRGVLFACYAFLFGAWYHVLSVGWFQGFLYLYVYVIGISCSFYLIIEAVLLYRAPTKTGLKWVVVAGISGGIGLAAISDPQISFWMCLTFGCYFQGDFLWFVLTDVSMWCLLKYYLARVEATTLLVQNSQEKQPTPQVPTGAYYIQPQQVPINYQYMPMTYVSTPHQM